MSFTPHQKNYLKHSIVKGLIFLIVTAIVLFLFSWGLQTWSESDPTNTFVLVCEQMTSSAAGGGLLAFVIGLTSYVLLMPNVTSGEDEIRTKESR